jgi:multidrug resistance efflux pump
VSIHSPVEQDEPDALTPVWAQAAGTTPAEAFYAPWLAYLCESIADARSGVVVVGAPDVGPFSPQAFWPSVATGAARLADVAEDALGRRSAAIAALDADGASPGCFGLAVPLVVEGQLHGVVAVELVGREPADLHAALAQMQWATAWIDRHLRGLLQGEAVTSERSLVIALDQVATLLQDEGFEPACRSLVTDLALRLVCDRVSFGLLRGGHVRPMALSHSADVAKRSGLTQAIGAAMDEALDQKALIRFPTQPGDDIVVTRDHAQLAVHHGSGSLLTIPLQGGDEFLAALTFERASNQPFTREDVDLCQSVAVMAGRVLALKKRNERSWLRHGADAAQAQLARLIGPRHVKRKLLLLLLLAGGVFFSMFSVDYRVNAPATLEGAVRRSVAAPFDGFVATAAARAGDVVKINSVLATLDERDLRLERLKWASQYAQYVKQRQEAVAGRDRAKAQIVQALYEQAQAQINLLDEQIARANVKAPFDGVIVKGDLSQSLGAAVRRGDVLFEVTPLASYRVVVEIDERDITDITSGQHGTLLLASIADNPLGFRISNVTSVTTAKDGRNFFRVEGMVDDSSDRLRPGMEGIAKIEIAPRLLIWVWTHRLTNWLRLFIWTYLP